MDAQLVELAAARLNTDLAERVLVLQTLLAASQDAATPDLLAGAGPLLSPFDRGLHVFNPAVPHESGATAPLASLAADNAARAAAVARPGEPAVVLTAAPDGSIVVLIGLTDRTAQWVALGAVSAQALNLPALLAQLSGEGRRTVAFLVDGSGRVIYHSDPALVGQDLPRPCGYRGRDPRAGRRHVRAPGRLG